MDQLLDADLVRIEGDTGLLVPEAYVHPLDTLEPLQGPRDRDGSGPSWHPLDRSRLTGDTALRLGHFFDTSPESWLNLQSLYELRRAEERVGKTIKNLPTLKRGKGRRQAAHA